MTLFFGGFIVKVTFSFKSQGIEKLDRELQNLRFESLITVDPKCKKNQFFAVLNIK